jgi:tellurite resistance protein
MSTDQAELTHALAFLYLAAAQATDGTLTPDEMRTLAEKLGTRAPDLSLEDLGSLLRQTVDAYKAIGSVEEKLERAHAHAETLRDAIDEKMRQAIVDDLLAIARADGNVSDEEVAFIGAIAIKMGLYPNGSSG